MTWDGYEEAFFGTIANHIEMNVLYRVTRSVTSRVEKFAALVDITYMSTHVDISFMCSGYSKLHNAQTCNYSSLALLVEVCMLSLANTISWWYTRRPSFQFISWDMTPAAPREPTSTDRIVEFHHFEISLQGTDHYLCIRTCPAHPVSYCQRATSMISTKTVGEHSTMHKASRPNTACIVKAQEIVLTRRMLMRPMLRWRWYRQQGCSPRTWCLVWIQPQSMDLK